MEETRGASPGESVLGQDGVEEIKYEGFGQKVRFEPSMLVPLGDIAVFERIRKKTTKIAEMAVSLKEHGQIQAVIVRKPEPTDPPEQVKGKPWVLVAGGRRFAGATLNDWTHIRAEEISSLSPYERKKIELEENLQREEMHFADVVETKMQLHELYVGENPSHRVTDTAAIIGESIANVSRDLQLAQALRDNPELRNAGSKKAAVNAVKMQTHATAKRLEIEARGTTQASYVTRVVTEDMRSWLRRLPTGTVDIVLADLPYGIDYFDLPVGDDLSAYDDSKETTQDLLADAVPELLRVTSETGWLVLMAGAEGFHFLSGLVRDCCVTHFQYRVHSDKPFCHGGTSKLAEPCRYLKVPPKPWIWYRPNSRNNSMHPDLHAQNQYEEILVLNRGKAKIVSDERVGNVLVHDAQYNDRIHEMQKPVELWVDILDRLALLGSFVIDPCFGSGSALAACAQRSMMFAGCDSNPNMRDAAIGFISLYDKE